MHEYTLKKLNDDPLLVASDVDTAQEDTTFFNRTWCPDVLFSKTGPCIRSSHAWEVENFNNLPLTSLTNQVYNFYKIMNHDLKPLTSRRLKITTESYHQFNVNDAESIIECKCIVHVHVELTEKSLIHALGS